MWPYILLLSACCFFSRENACATVGIRRGQHTNDNGCGDGCIHQRVYLRNTTNTTNEQSFFGILFQPVENRGKQGYILALFPFAPPLSPAQVLRLRIPPLLIHPI